MEESNELYEDEEQDGTGEPDRDDLNKNYFDMYVGAEVLLPIEESMQSGKVKRRKINLGRNPIGKGNQKPVLDTRVYTVEFPDGAEKEYAANIIAENMWAQCDIDGNQTILMEAIVDHKSDASAVKSEDAHITVNGRQNQNKTTKGWTLCVQWKDGTTTWERLADLKESNPVKISDYATAHNIAHLPAFVWWVGYNLRKRELIISAVNARYLKRTHKFGIKLPKNV